jgi:H+/Cl- antiporter ClcA
MAAGCGLGAMFALVVCGYMLPNWPTSPALPVVICTAASYFAGVTQSPLSSSVILMEAMSLDGSWILPVLSCAMVGTFAAKYTVCPWPIYEKLADIAIEGQEMRKAEKEEEEMKRRHSSQGTLEGKA